MHRLTAMIHRIGLKRLGALALGPAFVMLAVDAWIGHFAGKEGNHWAQWIPVFAGPVALAVLFAAAAFADSSRIFRFALTGAGISSALVGLAGTVYHLLVLWDDLRDETLNFSSLSGALSLAPPAFAPLAFTGVGGALVLIAWSGIRIELAAAAAPTEEAAEAPVPLRRAA